MIKDELKFQEVLIVIKKIKLSVFLFTLIFLTAILSSCSGKSNTSYPSNSSIQNPNSQNQEKVIIVPVPNSNTQSQGLQPRNTYVPPCPYCHGMKWCPSCKGSKINPVYFGGNKTTCPTCNGNGICPYCNGTGIKQ